MSGKDVEMSDAASQQNKDAQTKPTTTETGVLLLSDLKRQLSMLEKAVETKETRLISRVLRSLATTRRRLTVQALKQLIEHYFVHESDQEAKKRLLGYLAGLPEDIDKQKVNPNNNNTAEVAPMEVSAASSSSTTTTASTTPTTTAPKKEEAPRTTAVLPEVEVYVHLLVTIYLLDHKRYHEAASASTALIERLQNSSFNRRTLNPLSAKAYFYYSLTYELTGKFEDIRSTLLSAHRTASLRHNDEAQATLLNLLLRNYLHYNLYDQADKLVSKTTFREDSVSSNEYARYLYYQGKIRSIQLDYTEAYRCLLGAMRKAPQNSARGFRVAVHKLACIVQLLMGEIPERSIFRQPGLKKALSPYFQLTQTVRVGDLNAFKNVVNTFASLFKADKTYTLIQRLHHNVIKTGLRKINLSYSRISFDDICAKLHLDSVEDAEFIVAKAIRDGVINASINHEARYIQSKESGDIYSTQEPQAAFHRRIEFCLNTHNEAIKAMRFPPETNTKKQVLESAKERREREQEIAKNLAEDDEDEF